MGVTAPGARGRIEQLDTLRGVAVILVLVHHAMQAVRNSTEDVWTGLAGYVDVGRMGVVIFFMISGFVIVKAMPGTTPRAAGIFWRHRFFRLYPPFWVAIGFALLVTAAVGRSTCCTFDVRPGPGMLLANLTMIPLRFHEPTLVGVFWTLELELLFYALVTLIGLLGQIRYSTMLGVAALLFVGAALAALLRVRSHGTNEIGKDQLFTTLLHLSLMFSGAAVRYHWDRVGQHALLRAMPRELLGFFAMVAAFFAGVVAMKLRHGFDAHTFRAAITYLSAIGWFLLCLRFGSGSWLGAFLGNRSYGAYLVHLPILSLIALGASLSGVHMPFAGYLVIDAAATLVLADLMRRFVERPAIRLGHRRDGRPVPSLIASPQQAGF